jgi:hypothetical protein
VSDPDAVAARVGAAGRGPGPVHLLGASAGIALRQTRGRKGDSSFRCALRLELRLRANPEMRTVAMVIASISL